MHRVLRSRTPGTQHEAGSAIFLMPAVSLMIIYLTGFLVDLGTVLAKADGLNQVLSLSAASATTQISASAFFDNGKVVLNPANAEQVAVRQMVSAMPKGTLLEGAPRIRVQGGAICVRATELIGLPFRLSPTSGTTIAFTSTASALAKGSTSATAPNC